MLSKKLTLLLALCLLLVALVAGKDDNTPSKQPKSNPNNKMWRKTKPPTTKDPYADAPATSKRSKTKPPSAQKPIRVPPQKPEEPNDYKKCTAKYCDKTVYTLEKITDDAMVRCNVTTCREMRRWQQAFTNVSINVYTPKPTPKDSEYCWGEFCRRATIDISNKLGFYQRECNSAKCPDLFRLITAARFYGATIPAPRA